MTTVTPQMLTDTRTHVCPVCGKPMAVRSMIVGDPRFETLDCVDEACVFAGGLTRNPAAVAEMSDDELGGYIQRALDMPARLAALDKRMGGR